MVFEGGHELGSAVDLDAFDRKGSGGDELVKEDFGGVGGGFGRDVAEGPFGDGIVGGEVFDRLVGRALS